jgi:hypothetical protein
MFGLMASVDRPESKELFPMASGFVIQSEGLYVLVTAGHFLQQVERWKEQNRLSKLLLIVHHKSELCFPIQLDLDKNPSAFCEGYDFGLVVLDGDVVAEIAKRGGSLTRRDNLVEYSAEPTVFFVVGLAAAYCKVGKKIIATQDRRSERVEWTVPRLSDVAVVTSRLELDGYGPDRGTFQFAIVSAYDDYSGTSGGPIFGFAEGTPARDYVLAGIQSKQILSPTREQRPTHLIAVSAALAIHVIDGSMRRTKEALAKGKHLS